MNNQIGKVLSVNGNMISIRFDGDIMQNEVAYVITHNKRLKSEVIRINGDVAFLQVFENTTGVKVGDNVEFSGDMLSVQLGPGLMAQIFDGLQNPLPGLAKECGFFLPIGVEKKALSDDTKWDFTPLAQKGDKVLAGYPLGYVPEGIFRHKIMVPFYLADEYTVEEIITPGSYTINEKIAVIKDSKGKTLDLTMVFNYPVKIPVTAYQKKLPPTEPLITKVRIIDTLFPIAKGGTYCIPGPFGAGKTVLQQLTSRYADVDIVIIAACGERAGEVVETLKEFPELLDPKTGRSLMERTIIICNTSSMPVAARESSVYTAAATAEYYRQMGLQVLLLADSTSRWAQAMREISGRLEEIPGEEAYPAYLESRIASFYERAGLVELFDGSIGSLTIGGTVSPAGGNFEEPVTQGTLKVVGAFHGLSRDRANARKFPSIDPLESWSKYKSIIARDHVEIAKQVLLNGHNVNQMMKVVGEEGTSVDDYTLYLKSDFIDSVYLQQNAFDEVDAATSADRQKRVFDSVITILQKELSFRDKKEAREFFYHLRHKFIDWNYKPWNSPEFIAQEKEILHILEGDN
ncbi:MAG TPA: V-type ATP synthase subunit A [Candidatus Margulisbacteria bacterium]|nr:MAG: V-type ATP synthase subunit A [Candidatus Margulisbacteria bacterium GWD2_39_127]OGI03841.1 MAG: V-type ATP synthase subunit A [Candidatus Margulisbacteria bacterium GWF2_38_17]OGI06400.1 MAG: V-type ATP synthase subunit A [Candidatus Margulisbacteria bacterium GWE2_39_32]HAR63531.1 V-type ATP synthase subunit A [Candidatus Margulisiibacteriota bacterium]HCT86168.1 V-type ATP synthase subunit A [Candidatus Margulisiibacteriota bacterium]